MAKNESERKIPKGYEVSYFTYAHEEAQITSSDEICWEKQQFPDMQSAAKFIKGNKEIKIYEQKPIY